ncbi:MAG: hypothetical protein II877_01705 [Synergistaceae bacterium]|nr:hypothetical protein [Synergistaceae bacterium]
MEDRDSKGRFIKGNPGGGRPKKQPTTRELLQEISPQAVARLGDLIHSDDEAVALQASFDILELSLKCEQDSKKHSVDDRKSIEEEIREIQEHFAKFNLCFTFNVEPFYSVNPRDINPI